MNHELKKLIHSAPEEVGDEAYAFVYPKTIYMQWGDAAYGHLLELLLASEEEAEQAKITTILETLGFYSDGPPIYFVQTVFNLLEQKQDSPNIVTACLNASVYHFPVWRETRVHREIELLCENALETLDFQPEKNSSWKFWTSKTPDENRYCRFLKGHLKFYLKRNNQRRAALRAAAQGTLIIPESVIEQVLKEDERHQHLLGLNRVSHTSLTKMLIYASCWPKAPYHEDLLEQRSSELISTPLAEFPSRVQPEKKLVSTIWHNDQDLMFCREFHFL